MNSITVLQKCFICRARMSQDVHIDGSTFIILFHEFSESLFLGFHGPVHDSKLGSVTLNWMEHHTGSQSLVSSILLEGKVFDSSFFFSFGINIQLY